MANRTKSALKAQRVSERRRVHNKPIRTATRTALADAREVITDGSAEEATAAARQAQSALDKAARKGIIKHNNASRRNSRLTKLLKSAQADKVAAKAVKAPVKAAKPAKASTKTAKTPKTAKATK